MVEILIIEDDQVWIDILLDELENSITNSSVKSILYKNQDYDYFLDWPDLNVSPEAAKQTHFSMQKYNSLKSDKLKALEYEDVFDFIHKPISQEKLINLIKQL